MVLLDCTITHSYQSSVSTILYTSKRPYDFILFDTVFIESELVKNVWKAHLPFYRLLSSILNIERKNFYIYISPQKSVRPKIGLPASWKLLTVQLREQEERFKDTGTTLYSPRLQHHRLQILFFSKSQKMCSQPKSMWCDDDVVMSLDFVLWSATTGNPSQLYFLIVMMKASTHLLVGTKLVKCAPFTFPPSKTRDQISGTRPFPQNCIGLCGLSCVGTRTKKVLFTFTGTKIERSYWTLILACWQAEKPCTHFFLVFGLYNMCVATYPNQTRFFMNSTISRLNSHCHVHTRTRCVERPV